LKRDTLKNRFKEIAEYLKRGTLKYLRLDKALKNGFKEIAEYLKRGTLKYLRLNKKDLILEARYA